MKNFKSILLAALAAVISISCDPQNPNTDDPTPPIDGDLVLKIELSTTVIQADGEDAVELTAILGDQIITEGVTYYDAKTNSPVTLTDNRFTTTTAGNHTFWASYQTYISDKVTVKAVDFTLPDLPQDPNPASTSFYKKMLAIYFTGTGCRYCPYMKDIVHNMQEDPEYADRFILTAAHTFNAEDPAYLSAPLANAMSVTNYPSLAFDMFMMANDYRYENIIRDIFDETYNRAESAAGISASAIMEQDQVAIRVSIKAAVEGEFRVGAFLLEDGIYGKQTGGTKDEHNNHDDCIRAIEGRQSNSDFTGVNFGVMEAGKEKETLFTMNVKNDWVKDNLKLVVFVSYYSKEDKGYTVTNCAALDVNGSVQYLYK